MLLLTSTSDIVRLITGTAVSAIEVHASFVDVSGSTVTPGRTNTRITTATTTTIVPAPGASTQRNVKGLYIANSSTGTSCPVAVVHFDGTNSVELMRVILRPSESLVFREDNSWVHFDHNGAEYSPTGLGAYAGHTIPFMKSSTPADAVGYWYCTSKDSGYPGAWSPGTPGVNGRVTDGTTADDYGCIPIPNATVGANYLTAVDIASSVIHTNQFFDCLWVNSGLNVTTTTEQAITTPTLPARDINGTTNGEGCSIALLFTSASGLGGPSAVSTVRYTNSKGVGSRVATLSGLIGAQIPGTPVIGTIVWFQLAPGDTGVRSIEGITLGNSLVSGSISLMICRHICTITTQAVNAAMYKTFSEPGIRLYNGTCLLHNILATSTSTTFFTGSLTVMEK